MKDFTLALLQMTVSGVKARNWETAKRLATKAVTGPSAAEMVVLPECFNSPYGLDFFIPYSEPVPRLNTLAADIQPSIYPTASMLSSLAKDLNVYVVGGSIPEVEGEETGQDQPPRYYNTCMVFDRCGTLIGRHRKVHLFDIQNVGEKRMTFQESKVLSPGGSLTMVETEFGKISIGICYDLRFPRLVEWACQQGCWVSIFPAAFNTTTGPMHWSLLQRARAVDNQMYIAAASPASCEGEENPSSYPVYGHSSIVDPWGKVLAEAGTQEELIVARLSAQTVLSMRDQIPVLKQKRPDLYG